MKATSIFTDDIYNDNRIQKSQDDVRHLIENGLSTMIKEGFESAFENDGTSSLSFQNKYVEFSIYQNDIGEDGKYRIYASLKSTYNSITISAVILQYHNDGNFIPWRINEEFDITRILHKELAKDKMAFSWYRKTHSESKKTIEKFIQKVIPIIINNACETFNSKIPISA